ncbi:MAG TPA: hypothetical protein GX507_10005, partial [Clostridia bacterium]|nr:hypothetical protein [Clostridia bacterium]
MPKGAETLLGRKPYTFVPILEVRPQDRRGIVPHNQFERGRFTGQLRLSLEVITPLHIGCGSFRLSQGKVAYGFYRRNGRPAIPGSSLKGAVRSLAEAASRSCATLPTRNCPRLEDALPRGAGKSCNDESACPSCRLFGFVHGRNGYRGRVV